MPVFRIFDRYLIKNFLVPFFYSLFGMVAIWMVYDLGEHANDFQEAHLGFEAISKFYLVQIPFIVVNWPIRSSRPSTTNKSASATGSLTPP